METWFSDRDFQDNLIKFNDRKNDIKTMKLDQFINIYYPKAYARFFNTMLKERRVSLRNIIEYLHPNVDISDLLNLGATNDYIGPYVRVFTEVLRLYNYPTYY